MIPVHILISLFLPCTDVCQTVWHLISWKHYIFVMRYIPKNQKMFPWHNIFMPCTYRSLHTCFLHLWTAFRSITRLTTSIWWVNEFQYWDLHISIVPAYFWNLKISYIIKINYHGISPAVIYAKASIGLISPTSYLCHLVLWQHHASFMTAFSEHNYGKKQNYLYRSF
jgi:hypothetical protein